MPNQRIGAILDGLGVELDLTDGCIVTSAVVFCKVVKEDGTVTLGYAQSEGMCWIEGVGLITAGSDIARRGYAEDDDD
ncbi:hypothetical protein [Planobispora rosea]|uniref:hypothetical protein n=1 Tax=Planobispora rosea TaxID=35762 RepID=UPI00083AF51F|nr:hypothetical protein [Planobispora rosea]